MKVKSNLTIPFLVPLQVEKSKMPSIRCECNVLHSKGECSGTVIYLVKRKVPFLIFFERTIDLAVCRGCKLIEDVIIGDYYGLDLKPRLPSEQR